MPELADQLQVALGTGYRIERELGGGGMSRVFLAEEVALGRRVVVKVLPPEMAAGVNAERFRREIQLAARLQHPHIVPLLTAGASHDLAYYVMPFIEGESLRAKLARGELPVPETVRILRDVVDALAYAHSQNVVHRDIKPDNVLLSGNHAMVTDFGVAKAVADAAESHELTSVGVALGTPLYMAPEQAAADPNTDHRADIYAVGALAYEMLCGQPPFTGRTAQALIAAHLAHTPDPVSRHRPAVPPALEALVMRCLEKKPADRWQHAKDLLPVLEGMLTSGDAASTLAAATHAAATPPGAGGPSAAAPLAAISSGTRRAVARSHPARVTLLFALACVVVLAVVYALVRGLGLPYWVLYAAAGLLVVGLPLTLITSHHERRRALAHAQGDVASTPSAGVRRLFTWRSVLLGGAAAFAGLGIVTAGYMAMRLLGIGPAGTLLASGRLAPRDLLVVADFDNRTPDTTLAASVTEALRIDLSQSPAVKLMDATTVAGALRRMDRDPRSRLDAATAREVAERDGAKAVVTGDVGPLGSGYVLGAKLTSAADGSELVALRETADNSAGIIAAVDRLSKHMRERIGESLKTIRANKPLEQVTTSSLEALRLYTEGDRAANHGDFVHGIQQLRQAIALDSTFGMAYRKLAVALGNSSASREATFAAMREAYRYRDRLPLRERYLTIALYAPDYEDAAAAYRTVLATYPDDWTALNDISGDYIEERQYAQAVSSARRAMAGDPLLPEPYWNVMRAQVALHHLTAADSVLGTLRQALPHARLLPIWSGAMDAMAHGNFDLAGVELDSARTAAGADLSWRSSFSYWLADVAALRGRLKEARDERLQGLQADQQRRLPGAGLRAAIEAATVQLRLLHDSSAALRQLADTLARSPLSSLSAVDRPYVELATLYAEAGHGDDARRLLAQYRSDVDEWSRGHERLLRAARSGTADDSILPAEIALADGHTADAIARLRRYLDGPGCELCGLFELADAYDHAEQPDSAIAYYQKLVETPSWWRVTSWSTLPIAYQRLCQLYGKADNVAGARKYCGELIALWKDADPQLQPAVQAAKQELAALAKS